MVIDRRVVRTRSSLYDALVALIRRKNYDLITVEDILHEANVGRSTFYAHFASKDDLLRRSLERLKVLLLATQRRQESGGVSDQTPSVSRALFEHVAEYADIQVALAGGRGGQIVEAAIEGVLKEVLSASMRLDTTDGLPRDRAVRHIVGTFNTTLRWWFVSGLSVSPQVAEEHFRRLLSPGLPSAFCSPFISEQV